MDCPKCEDTGEVTVTVKCDECDGSGEMDCPHCGNDTDCDVCDGTGTIVETEDCDCDAARFKDMGYGLAYLERTASDVQRMKA